MILALGIQRYSRGIMMGAEIFYKLSNNWFYQTVRPSYKGVVDSYSAISKVRYPGSDLIVSRYRVASNPAYNAKPSHQYLGKYWASPNPVYHTFKPKYQSLGSIGFY
jgi:hypothetical protein